MAGVSASSVSRLPARDAWPGWRSWSKPVLVANVCCVVLVLAPAMNVKMWDHPATQANAVLLRERGVTIVDVGQGDLACGYQGSGRLADLDAIMAAIDAALPGCA